jgi:hypothetical protein
LKCKFCDPRIIEVDESQQFQLFPRHDASLLSRRIAVGLRPRYVD